MYIQWSCNPFLLLWQHVRISLLSCGLQGSNPQPELRLMDWIWLRAGECNQCRQAQWMTQTWDCFWCWIPCVFWLSVLVKFTWLIKSVCHFMLQWSGLRSLLAFWMLAFTLYWSSIFQFPGKGSVLQTHFLDHCPSVVNHSFSAHLFVMSWKTQTCGRWIKLSLWGVNYCKSEWGHPIGS